jgi:murein DD-endopeptidase MepM/ murein hydrolase activator NlpD
MEEKDVTFTDSTIIPICNVFHDACYPVKNKINSPFGYRGSRFHKGLDIDLERGDTVLAAFDGKVRYAKYNNGGFGNLVIIRHNNGLETYYAHLNKLKVKPNDTVRAGQLIGLGGNSGARHSGAHLHFEVRIEDKPIDPAIIFDTETFSLKTDELELASEIFAPSRRSHRKVTYDKNATIYRVRSGDCLSKIAKRHGTSVNSLYRLNGLSPRSVLQIGQKIRIR